MPRPIDLASHVQKLLEGKQQHTNALKRIEETLQQIGSLLSKNGNRPRGQPAPRATAISASAPVRRRRRRRSFGTTAEELVLSFVKQKRKPTTREINAHWKSEGRGHTADNTLGKLVRERKLKRTPLEGERGSRYSPI